MRLIQQVIGGVVLFLIITFIWSLISLPEPPTAEEIKDQKENTILYFIKTDSNLDDYDVAYIDSLPKEERQKFIPYRYQGQLVTQ